MSAEAVVETATSEAVVHSTPATAVDSPPSERASDSAPEAPRSPFELLLARPEALMHHLERGTDLNAIVRTALLTVVLGAAIYGAALGAYRGGLQILYAAVKLPIVLLLTTAACAPALTAVGASLGRRADVRRDIALVLSSLARTSLTLVALTPLFLLFIRRDSAYHNLVLLLVATAGLAGAVGIWFFLRGLHALDETAPWTTALTVSAVFMLVGVQMSWTLRPYLVRPSAPDIVFVRNIEGSFLEAVHSAATTAAGVDARVREAGRGYEE